MELESSLLLNVGLFKDEEKGIHPYGNIQGDFI
jgi:hypothetical protein